MRRGCGLGGLGCLGALAGLLFVPVLVIVLLYGVFFGGIGGLFTATPGANATIGPIATRDTRPFLWLPDYTTTVVPNTLEIAMAALLSQGHTLTTTQACAGRTVVNGSCANPTWTAAGLLQVPVTPPTASTNALLTAATGIAAGTQRLQQLIARTPRWHGTPLWDPLLQTIATQWGGAQAPAGSQGPSATQLKALLQRTYSRPLIGGWAIANWNGSMWHSSGTSKVWVLAVAAGPYGPAWSEPLTPPPPPECHTVHVTVPVTHTVTVTVPVYRTVPTYRVVRINGVPFRIRTGTEKIQIGTKQETRTVTTQTHETRRTCVTLPAPSLTGRDLVAPAAMWVTSQGVIYPMRYSLEDPGAVVAAPGSAVWGVQMALPAGIPTPTLHARWVTPQGVITASAPLVQTGSSTSAPIGGLPPVVVNTQSLATILHSWLPDLRAAAQATGVPIAWLGAEMLHESGGNPVAGALSGAYGLMQIEPGTAQGLPGYTPGARQNPADNLLLGAELLQETHQTTGSWYLASAQYYGGLENMEIAGYQLGMSWATAAPVLEMVPDPQAGNTETMTAYAESIAAMAQAIAPDLSSSSSSASPAPSGAAKSS